MKTVILEPPPAEVTMLLERRRALGQDRHDEVWEGVYHVVPGPSARHGSVDAQLLLLLAPRAREAGLHATTALNLGENADDFRVPDGGYHRGRPAGRTFVPAAAIVVEVASPEDETYEKFDFYARRGVEEIVVADLAQRRVRCWARAGDVLSEVERSTLLDVEAASLTAGIDWPDDES
jgi:Uma2 family endonuclease